MPYTPVPAVSAGDWIDEVFINTYWVDNMAAGVPDVFTAKGQLPVGLGVDSMGILNAGANGTILEADSTQTTGLKWGPKSPALVLIEADSANGPTAVGTTTRSAVTDFGIPSGCSGIFIGLIGTWADVSGSPLAYVRRASPDDPAVRIYGVVNSKKAFSTGFVQLNSDNYEVTIVVAALAAALELWCYGYITQ